MVPGRATPVWSEERQQFEWPGAVPWNEFDGSSIGSSAGGGSRRSLTATSTRAMFGVFNPAEVAPVNWTHTSMLQPVHTEYYKAMYLSRYATYATAEQRADLGNNHFSSWVRNILNANPYPNTMAYAMNQTVRVTLNLAEAQKKAPQYFSSANAYFRDLQVAALEVTVPGLSLIHN